MSVIVWQVRLVNGCRAASILMLSWLLNTCLLCRELCCSVA